MKSMALLVAVCCLVTAPASVHVSPEVPGAAAGRSAGPPVGTFDLPFMANEGQTDRQVAYYTRTFAGTVFVTKSGAIVYSVPGAGQALALREEFIGARPIAVSGETRIAARISSFAGPDAARWRRNVATYAGVRLRQPYPGIDVTLKARGRNVEKVFSVAPGADPGLIRLRMSGGRGVRVDGGGRLEIGTPAGAVTFSAPVAFQERNGATHPVDVSYGVDGDTYTFVLGAYDRSLPLVIDPFLASTLVGGGANEIATSLMFAPDGSVIVAGVTASADFPATVGAYDTTSGGTTDAFIAKFDAGLTTLQAATFFGGTSGEDSVAAALDSAGNVFLAGRTDSTDLPVTPGAFQATRKAGTEAFVAKLDASLGNLLASSYLGGSRNDAWCCGVSMNVDSAGNVFVTMLTNSTDFPTTVGAYDRTYNDFDTDDIVIAKFNNSLTTLLAGTYLGGYYWDVPYVSRLDAAGNLYVAGRTSSFNYPTTPGAYHLDYPDPFPWYDGFVSKLSNNLTTLLASTYVGSTSALDIFWDLDIAQDGSVYVAGSTASSAFPVTVGAFDTTYNGGAEDGFVVKLNPNFSAVVASTFLGGSSFERAAGISLDAAGDVHVGGWTSSSNFPTTPDALFPFYHSGGASGYDGFYVKLNGALAALETSTFIGGSGDDFTQRPVLNADGEVYLRGDTSSSDFPTTAGGYDSTHNGGADAYVMRLGTLAPPNSAPAANAGANQSVACGANCTAAVTLDGSASSDPDGDTLSYEWTGPFGTVTGGAPTVTLGTGTHVVTLTVDDGNGGTATDTVTITVEDTTPPAFTSAVGPFTISVTGTGGTPFTVPLPGASDNCVDVTVTSDAPALFPMGPTTVTFTATDAAGNSATASTTVTVVNAAPVAIADAATTTAGTAVTIAVLANDTDADGHALTVTGVTQGSHGTVVINADGTVTYTPAVPTLAGLIARVGALPLSRGQINSLLSKLEAASRSLARGNETAARNQIQAFVNEVEAMARSGRMDSGLAAELIAWANGLVGGASLADSFTYTVSDGYGGTASAAVSITIAVQ